MQQPVAAAPSCRLMHPSQRQMMQQAANTQAADPALSAACHLPPLQAHTAALCWRSDGGRRSSWPPACVPSTYRTLSRQRPFGTAMGCMKITASATRRRKMRSCQRRRRAMLQAEQQSGRGAACTLGAPMHRSLQLVQLATRGFAHNAVLLARFFLSLCNATVCLASTCPLMLPRGVCCPFPCLISLESPGRHTECSARSLSSLPLRCASTAAVFCKVPRTPSCLPPVACCLQSNRGQQRCWVQAQHMAWDRPKSPQCSTERASSHGQPTAVLSRWEPAKCVIRCCRSLAGRAEPAVHAVPRSVDAQQLHIEHCESGACTGHAPWYKPDCCLAAGTVALCSSRLCSRRLGGGCPLGV